MGNVHEFYTMDKTERCAHCLQFVCRTNRNGECMNCKRSAATNLTGGFQYKVTTEVVHSAILVCMNICIVARDSNGDPIPPYVFSRIRSSVKTVLE